tara:strand:- start:5217 stop:5339 length:123 start_codon:yes stop_codon:yes gene_type:complete
VNPNNVVCYSCGGPAELEYNDDGRGVAYAHCIERCDEEEE